MFTVKYDHCLKKASRQIPSRNPVTQTVNEYQPRSFDSLPKEKSKYRWQSMYVSFFSSRAVRSKGRYSKSYTIAYSSRKSGGGRTQHRDRQEPGFWVRLTCLFLPAARPAGVRAFSGKRHRQGQGHTSTQTKKQGDQRHDISSEARNVVFFY